MQLMGLIYNYSSNFVWDFKVQSITKHLWHAWFSFNNCRCNIIKHIWKGKIEMMTIVFLSLAVIIAIVVILVS